MTEDHIGRAVPGWQGMDSAPKDGTVLLGWIVHRGDDFSPEPFERPSLIHWVEYEPEAIRIAGVATGWDKQWIGDPVAWMPLPDPPEVTG